MVMILVGVNNNLFLIIMQKIVCKIIENIKVIKLFSAQIFGTPCSPYLLQEMRTSTHKTADLHGHFRSDLFS